MDALEVYRALMKDHLAPGMRELGFKGSNGSFVRPSPRHWVTIGFQRTPYGSAEGTSFTINLAVTSKEVWARKRAESPVLGERPSANTFDIDGSQWTARIGDVLPGGADRWWAVRPGRPDPALVDEVLDAIRSYAIPALDAVVSAVEP